MKNQSTEKTFLEMRQKLMQRFLDGHLDQGSYERMLADIEAMERTQHGYGSEGPQEPSTAEQDENSDRTFYDIPRRGQTPPSAGGVHEPRHPGYPGYAAHHEAPPMQTVTLIPTMPAGQMRMGMPLMVPGMIYDPSQMGYPAAMVPGQAGIPHPPQHQEKPLAKNGNHGRENPSPAIMPEVIRSLAPGQPLEIWWHHPLTQACADAWCEANVPIKLSLTMNASVTDASLQCLGQVTQLCELNLTSTAISDEGLAFLAQLPKLESLILTSTQVSGKTAYALSTLTNLKELTLTSSRFCDKGLEKLAFLEKLEVLKLDDTQITDEGLVHLEGLKSLRVLNLQGSIISDTGLESLAELINMERLYLGGTIPYEGVIYESPISNTGISRLKNLVNMRTLHLNDTQLTDSGIASLQKMAKLTELNLADTSVTDSCLVYLRRLDNLRSIIVDGTHISLSGVRKVLGARAVRRFHGATVGAWRRLGSFLSSPWSRKN